MREQGGIKCIGLAVNTIESVDHRDLQPVVFGCILYLGNYLVPGCYRQGVGRCIEQGTNLVFVHCLFQQFGIEGTITGALILYTVINTTLPAFVLRAQPADFEDVEALPLPDEAIASQPDT